ncbi:hypothetical protein LB467_10770 [Salegentibacter sp. JZCK2]|uniref:hypothetical protein n=1 Tax=Salegentibacter tibetensis TaxID=2873600 RepID=UPI001CCAB6A2|nr:hypothetical protein [Salegentibacter tibetensis]MBZ9730170.1 hypothetical protein [Salegentibacter tibetensis]
MENEKYIKDLSDIKQMMNRSSRFISLSGLAGVFAGFYAIIGAVIAKDLLSEQDSDVDMLIADSMNRELIMQLLFVAIAVLVLAIGTAVFLTTRKAKNSEEKIWDSTSKRLLINFFAPLTAGGIFCLVLLQYGLVGLIAPCMLIFYGLALIHASKYTFSDLRSLGYSNLILGLIATQFLSYGLYFWAVGFGLFHIVYGIWMYNKYDRKNA